MYKYDEKNIWILNNKPTNLFCITNIVHFFHAV